MKRLAVLCLGLVTSLQAATIAVIDSGTDLSHPQLKEKKWINPSLKLGSSYPLSVNGWNFAENNSVVFDHSLLNTFGPDVLPYMRISAKALLFSATEAEKTWAKEKSAVQGFSEEVGRFGSYVHGTHVAGIASKATGHKIMAIKLVATPSKKAAKKELEKGLDNRQVFVTTPEEQEKAVAFLLLRVAMQNASQMQEIAKFVADNGAQVANGSFGTGIPQAMGITSKIFEMVYERAPADLELVKFTKLFMAFSKQSQEVALKAAPQVLFVFAAGNDGLSNDDFGTVPANVKLDNTISVAATYQDLFFAPFSNYGVKMVDVAAPGMAINSAIPGNDYLEVSGTSQAAPLVARIAGLVKDTNSSLTPAQIKTILMGTVDKKDFLKLRVASGGIVNQQRAVFAAIYSKTMTLPQAIELSFKVVPVKKSLAKSMPVMPRNMKPIPMPSMFE